MTTKDINGDGWTATYTPYKVGDFFTARRSKFRKMLTLKGLVERHNHQPHPHIICVGESGFVEFVGDIKEAKRIYKLNEL